MTWPVAFALTLAVEVPIAVVVLASFGVTRTRSAAAAVLASSLTHPTLWLLRPGPVGLAVAEAMIVVVEGIVYRFVAPARSDRLVVAVAVSAVANAASLGVGLVLYAT